MDVQRNERFKLNISYSEKQKPRQYTHDSVFDDTLCFQLSQTLSFV
jgi:hypothetical protein